MDDLNYFVAWDPNWDDNSPERLVLVATNDCGSPLDSVLFDFGASCLIDSVRAYPPFYPPGQECYKEFTIVDGHTLRVDFAPWEVCLLELWVYGIPSVDRERPLPTPVMETHGNPARGEWVLSFGAPLSLGRRMKVEVFDVHGRLLGCAFEGLNDGRLHEITVTKETNLGMDTPGVYFARLCLDGKQVLTRKLVLVR